MFLITILLFRMFVCRPAVIVNK